MLPGFLLLFIAPTIPYLDPAFPPSRKVIQAKRPAAIRGAHAAAASASTDPACELCEWVQKMNGKQSAPAWMEAEAQIALSSRV